jgi:hypothetical protein
MELQVKSKKQEVAQNILQKAQAIIYGDREKTYGKPDKNLQKIAAMWGAYKGVPFSVADVCLMMALLKIARLHNQPLHYDSQIDVCGYLALLERVQTGK